jgi:sugar phosphate isomerase/epimerase
MERIRIGSQTAFSAPSVVLPFDFALAYGFDAFEWFPGRNESGVGWTEADLTKEQRTIIRDTALAHDIRLSVHAPWWANPLNPQALDVLFESVELAEDIGASLFNIHLYQDQGTASYAQAIIPLIDRLVSARIRLAIENTPLTSPGDFNELFRILDKTGLAGAGHVGMCFDLGHANLYQATHNDYLKFLDLIDSHVPIVHLHLHENYGDQDNHLTLFTGPAGKDASGIRAFLERMNRRCFSGCIIFEQWPEPPGLLVDARNRLLTMLGEVQEATSRSPSR